MPQHLRFRYYPAMPDYHTAAHWRLIGRDPGGYTVAGHGPTPLAALRDLCAQYREVGA